MSRLVIFVETSQTLPAILFFTAIAYKQNRIVAITETQTQILCLQVERARSKMLCAVDYIFNLLCAFNCLQPMKKIVFSVASRATGRLQIKPSGSGDENGNNTTAAIRQFEVNSLLVLLVIAFFAVTDFSAVMLLRLSVHAVYYAKKETSEQSLYMFLDARPFSSLHAFKRVRTKHGPGVHGPPLWTGSMDPLSWTRSMDSFFFIFIRRF